MGRSVAVYAAIFGILLLLIACWNWLKDVVTSLQ